MDFPGGSDGKASVYNAGDVGSIPGSGRFPGEGNGNALQYSFLENPMDRVRGYHFSKSCNPDCLLCDSEEGGRKGVNHSDPSTSSGPVRLLDIQNTH